MTQALYAHMNNKTIKKSKQKKFIFHQTILLIHSTKIYIKYQLFVILSVKHWKKIKQHQKLFNYSKSCPQNGSWGGNGFVW
jgi:hypothetical protein